MNFPEIEISVKFKNKPNEFFSLTSSEQIAQGLRQIFNADTMEWTEEMVLLCLNNANKPVGYFKLASGGMTGVVCDPRVIFTTALQCCAARIIIAHNHPSGNTTPSQADKEVTRQIKEAGKLLDIKLLDHIIITTDSYYSFADEGEL